jgi:hypothetical protein
MEQPSCNRLKGCLHNNATATVPIAIGVDRNGTHGLGLRSVKGDGEVCREVIH